MIQNLLLDKIVILQCEYKELLSKLIPYMEHDLMSLALDEIILFWNKNINLVQLFLRYYVENEDSYVFTAVTYMDIDDKENYPFMLMGNIHIMDDSLGKFAEVCNKMKNENISREFVELIIETARDNIKVINECNGKIVVLPLRLFNQITENSIVFQAGERAFTSLFTGISSINEYFHKCHDFADIMKYARADIADIVLFDEDDDRELSFETRFKNAVPRIPHIVMGDKSDAIIFFEMVYGCIQQAVDVIISCIEYKTIPMIRYPIALNYFMLLVDNFEDFQEGSELKYKSCIANMVYRLSNKDKLSINGFEHFANIVVKEKFSEELFDELKRRVPFNHQFNTEKVFPVIEDKLERIYIQIGKLSENES